jgi:hypothetical protein
MGLGLLLRTASLSIDYGIPLPTRFSAPAFAFGLFLYAAAAVAVVALIKRSPAASAGLALWLAALLPTQSFVPKLDPLTNRPLSLALAGLLLAGAPLLAAWMRSFRAVAKPRASWGPLGSLVCGIVLFAVTASATAQRAALFRSELALWRDAAIKSSANVRPHLQYAVLLKRAGRDRDAWSAADAAHRIDPLNSQAATMARVFRPGETSQ